MWGRRGNRRSKLPRQLALGMLVDAMGRVQDPGDEAPQTPQVPAPRRGGLIPAYLTRVAVLVGEFSVRIGNLQRAFSYPSGSWCSLEGQPDAHSKEA